MPSLDPGRPAILIALLLGGACTLARPVTPVPLVPTSNESLLYDRVRGGTVAIRGAGGNGSGILVDSSGLVLTHVALVGTADSARVILPNGAVVRGLVAARDVRLKLAVLAVDLSGCDSCTPLALGDTTARSVRGDRLMSVAAGASLTTSVTVGTFVQITPASMVIDAVARRGSLGAQVVDGSGRVVAVTAFPVPDSTCRGWMGAIPIATSARLLAVAKSGGQRPVLGPISGAADSLGGAHSPATSDAPFWIGMGGGVRAGGFAPPALVYASHERRHCQAVIPRSSSAGFFDSDLLVVDDISVARNGWASWDEYLSGRIPAVVVTAAPTIGEDLGGAIVGALLKSSDKILVFDGSPAGLTLYRDGIAVTPSDQAMLPVEVNMEFDLTDSDNKAFTAAISGATRVAVAAYPPAAFAPRSNGSWPELVLVVLDATDKKHPARLSLKEKSVRAIWDGMRPATQPGRPDNRPAH